MRVADKMNHEQVIANLNRNRNQLSEFQNQAALQKRITRPSDDPVGAARILESRSETQTLSQFEKNILSTRAFIEFSDESLKEVGDLLIRAKDLALQQANDGSGSSETRQIVALEIRQIKDQIIGVSNRRLGDRYLFGGYKTLTPPFDGNGNYYGDSGQIEVPVDKGHQVVMNIPGDEVFLGRQLGRKQSRSLEEENSTSPNLRAPSHWNGEEKGEVWRPDSVNIFSVLAGLERGLQTNDKVAIQGSLETLDLGLSQLNLCRAELGSRASVLSTGLGTLQKLKVDSKGLESTIEDVDIYELVNNLNRTQSQLQASLTTSGQLIQNSLLDFLR